MERSINSNICHFAAVSFTAGTFQDQNQNIFFQKHINTSPLSITDQARKPYTHLRLLREDIGMKTTTHDLQEEVAVCISSEEHNHVGKSRSESQLDSKPRLSLVLKLLVVPVLCTCLEKQESRS